MNTFNTIYNECKYYNNFNVDFKTSYNIFMTELLEQAQKEEDFNSKTFSFFCQSWRWTAQQNDLNLVDNSKIKKFLRKVYDAYNIKEESLTEDGITISRTKIM